MTDAAIRALTDFVSRHPRLFVLSGAGVSTDSGIPDYRDADGNWKQRQPIQLQAFVHQPQARQRYWARSMLGWPRFAAARPNPGHRALARLQRAGYIGQLVTQNVDGLHQLAGSQRVIDLHGRLDRVACLSCGHRLPRQTVQHWLLRHNADFAALNAAAGPDGDAHLADDIDLSGFRVPPCPRCHGMLKPQVVFFGETVPKPRLELALRELDAAPAVLVVGSSLMVYSGYRFCRLAHAKRLPVAALNLGRTRADPELALKLRLPVGPTLETLAAALTPL